MIPGEKREKEFCKPTLVRHVSELPFSEVSHEKRLNRTKRAPYQFTPALHTNLDRTSVFDFSRGRRSEQGGMDVGILNNIYFLHIYVLCISMRSVHVPVTGASMCYFSAHGRQTSDTLSESP